MAKKIKKVTTTTTVTEEVVDGKESTHIISILDTSGSMTTLINECIGGFNSFLKKQRELSEGECTISIILFDDQYEEIVKNVNIKEVKDITSEVWVPRGFTALYDAIGKAIVSESLRISKLEEKPTKVIVCIVTDGEENASKEYNRDNVKKLIKEFEDECWTFVFLATNQDAFKTAGTMGISYGNSYTFSNDIAGAQNAYYNVSSSVSAYRSMSTTDSKFKEMSQSLINNDIPKVDNNLTGTITTNGITTKTNGTTSVTTKKVDGTLT